MTQAWTESFWKNKRVLVTGAGGFIGSHLAERLVQLGARARALVHYRSDGGWGWLDQSPLKEDLEVVAGDIRDRDSVLNAMKDQEIVFHLAALIAIPYSYQTPASFMQTNVVGTLNVLQAARECAVERVVYTSTSEVYGTAHYVPMDEAHPLQAQSPYAATKIGADKLAEAFWLSFHVPVVTIRPFNTFGPRQSARAIVPTIITQCLTAETVRLGHLHPTRDLNYVADIVEGFVGAAAAPEAVGRTINLGSGREIPIEALARMIAQLIGREIAIEQDDQRVRPDSSEVDRLLADNRLAREVLGWRPVTSLEDGLQMTIEWFRAHGDAYRPGVYAI
jgi:dTDP-glucose 4,6-dehydratase